ncbi:hypothetical protein B0H13DRAFT_1857416 [Mycena leptocephala]|nr:hypothetical protein B0H13DRAFT_1857416 [Mycena leptocephala]
MFALPLYFSTFTHWMVAWSDLSRCRNPGFSFYEYCWKFLLADGVLVDGAEGFMSKYNGRSNTDKMPNNLSCIGPDKRKAVWVSVADLEGVLLDHSLPDMSTGAETTGLSVLLKWRTEPWTSLPSTVEAVTSMSVTLGKIGRAFSKTMMPDAFAQAEIATMGTVVGTKFSRVIVRCSLGSSDYVGRANSKCFALPLYLAQFDL